MQTQHRETDLGRTLFELREALGWSQMRVSRESGVSRVTISKLETGQIQAPKMETLRRLAKALDVPVEDLLNPKVARPSLESEEDEGRSAGSIAAELNWVTEEVLEPLVDERHAVIEGWRATGVRALRRAHAGAFEMACATDGIFHKLQQLGADEVVANRDTASVEDLDAAFRQINAFARLRGSAEEASNVARELSRLAGEEAASGFEEFEQMLADARRVESEQKSRQ